MNDSPKQLTIVAMRRAFAHLQQNQLDQAENCFRDILLRIPTHAEALHQLGRLLCGTARSREGQAFLIRAIEADPDKSAYWLSCALAQLAQGDGRAAIDTLARMHLRGLSCLADDRDTQNWQRDFIARIEAMIGTGRGGTGIAAYQAALAVMPTSPQLLNNLGTACLRHRDFASAEKHYRSAIRLAPARAEIYLNLSIALEAQGRVPDAANACRSALMLAPNYADAHYNLGNLLVRQNEIGEAVDCYRKSIKARPNFANAHFNLANLLLRLGDLKDAETEYRATLSLDDNFATAHFNLGATLCQQNRLDAGFAEFTRSAKIRYDGMVRDNTVRPPHQVKHDIEQQHFLDAHGIPHDATSSGLALTLTGGQRIAEPAVNPLNSVTISEEWVRRDPKIVVIDDFLSPEALENLRLFCRGSTIWRRAYDGGYLGAMPEFGFACPLLAQIAEGLRETFPVIFLGHALHYLWGFKYDGQLGGIKVHADQAAVNVNFWITPDEANLDAESGGLVVWDAIAPPDWELEKYNGDETAARAFLQRAGAKSVKIPYRANRAVIFDSDLFHETDAIHFKEGYLNRRINVTLLYGKRISR